MFACLVRLGTYNHIHGYDWIVLALKDFIDEAEEFTEELNLPTKEKTASAIKIRMEQLADRPELKREDAWDSGTEIVARASFFLGLLALIVFAIRNLPWSTLIGLGEVVPPPGAWLRASPSPARPGRRRLP